MFSTQEFLRLFGSLHVPIWKAYVTMSLVELDEIEHDSLGL